MDTPSVAISGSGKFMLLSLGAKTKNSEQMVLRGGSAFKLHKEIVALEEKIGNKVVPHGGASVAFFDEQDVKRIRILGESMKYGPIEFPDIVIDLLKKEFPEYTIEVVK